MALAVVVVIAVIAVVIFRGEGDPPRKEAEVVVPTAPNSPEESEVPAPADQQPAPVIKSVRHIANGNVEILWDARAAQVQQASHLTIDVWDLDQGSFFFYPDIPLDLRSFEFSPKEHQDTDLAVFVNAIYEGGEESPSEPWLFDYRAAVGEPLPGPAILEAERLVIDGRSTVLLSWDNASRDHAAFRGYVVLADDEIPGLLLEDAGQSRSFRESQYLAEPANQQARPVTFAVAAMDQWHRLGEFAKLTLEMPRASLPVPTELIVSLGDAPETVVQVTWAYPETPGLAGFRLYDHGQLVEDEQRLPASARSFDKVMVIPDWSYALELRAVDQAGVLSAAAHAAFETGPAKDMAVRPARPLGFTAHWVLNQGRPVVELKWDPVEPEGLIASIKIDVSEDEEASFAEVETLSADATSTLIPYSGATPQNFRLSAVSNTGLVSEYAEASVPSAALFAFPPRLTHYQESANGDAKTIEWQWRYPDHPLLAGFRIYQDGALVADESHLSAKSRSWQAGPFDEARTYVFEIESVMSGGHVSPRAPGQVYQHSIDQ